MLEVRAYSQWFQLSSGNTFDLICINTSIRSEKIVFSIVKKIKKLNQIKIMLFSQDHFLQYINVYENNTIKKLVKESQKYEISNAYLLCFTYAKHTEKYISNKSNSHKLKILVICESITRKIFDQVMTKSTENVKENE